VLDDSFTRKDGSIFPVAYSATPLMRGGAVRGSVVVFRDATTELTEQSQVDRELAGLAWVGRIRDAIDEDRLVLFAQPICPLTGGTQTDELLLRMRGHQGELVPPGSFLPIAERYKLIAEVDRWVLGRALDLAAQGRYVHVNLSADSLARADLPLLVERELKRSGADPAIVVFEVTETALLGDLGAGEACARGLAELGCAVALDDFGTGYASLSYLQKLPVQYLKIDITFIRDLIANPANMHVVEAIVHLAQSFGQKTIAEGVEDAPTLELVRRLGVDYAQGFHLGRPQPLSE
jgi:EAL domain-containing protein (putative c-di-GMP-specific phosphodiesterase class I)